MEVDFLILADAAQVAGDKLYVMGGGWTIVWGREFPLNHPAAVAVGTMVGWQETNQRHSLEIVLLRDGEQIGDPLVRGDFDVGRPPGIAPGTSQRFMVAATVLFNLDVPGTYEVVVRIDGSDARSATFSAIQLPGAPVS